MREQLDGKTHNTSAIPAAALIDTCEFLEEDCRDTYGFNIAFPIDREGAEYVFFPAVSDYLLEPDTLMGNAAVLTATGASWTIGTQYFDGINYGLFYSDRMLDRIVSKEADEVRRLKAKKVLIGECGHASRSAKFFIKTFCGGEDAPEVVNIMEYTARALREGRLRLRPDVINERVTYHDPCNIARSGWIVDQPREILRAICEDFVDMTPRGRDNYCCGGGGGSVSIDEIRPFRTRVGGAAKAEQIRGPARRSWSRRAPTARSSSARCARTTASAMSRSWGCTTSCSRRSRCRSSCGLPRPRTRGSRDRGEHEMDAWIDFARGPLFRVALVVCLLGLAYRAGTAVYQIVTSWRAAGDRSLPIRGIVRATLAWVLPFRLLRARPVYSAASVAFHVGILLVPLFSIGHVALWQADLPIRWPTLAPAVATVLASRRGSVAARADRDPGRGAHRPEPDVGPRPDRPARAAGRHGVRVSSPRIRPGVPSMRGRCCSHTSCWRTSPWC